MPALSLSDASSSLPAPPHMPAPSFTDATSESSLLVPPPIPAPSLTDATSESSLPAPPPMSAPTLRDAISSFPAPTPTTASSTQLDNCIFDLPWQDDHKLGFGMNAVTGRISQTQALEDFALPDDPAHYSVSEELSMQVLYDAETLKDLLGFSAGASLNIAPLDCSFGALTSITRSGCASTTTVISVVLYRSETRDERPMPSYELTEEAEELARRDPAAFRDKYGDYFIAGSSSGSLFIAIATCRCVDVEKRKAVTAVLQASASKAFSAQAAVTTDKALSSLHAEVTFRVQAIGLAASSSTSSDPAPNIDGGFQSFTEIITLLDSFKRHRLVPGPRICALLRHYSVARGMDDIIMTSLPISPRIFTNVERLRDTVLNCQLLSASLTEYGKDDAIVADLRHRVNAFRRDVRQSQTRVVTDQGCLAELSRLALELETQLKAFHDVHSLFLRLLRECKKQPGPFRQVSGDSFGYGLNLEHSRSHFLIEEGETVQITLGRWSFSNRAKGLVKRPPNGHIVGWRVTVDNPKHSSWRQHTASIILAPAAAIACKRERVLQNLFSSCTWTLTVFVVKDHRFLDIFYRQNDYDEKGKETTLVTAPTVSRKLQA